MSANGVRWFVAAHLLAVLAIYLIAVWIGAQHVAAPMPPLTVQASAPRVVPAAAEQADLSRPAPPNEASAHQDSGGIQASADIAPPWAMR
ncbi:MAG TPA: hypothetical protein VFW84_04315 [Aquabacterium sp.]|uniref:hypothetical protein n=1 Tax=Aquabacterium sp. TaxID=1872578 RepID=UPI002E33E41C|nr:hypothetical protein [Aquabacterium sp.]HEX5371935.1 hypothetical protein [Aquabacterium sp.]